MSNNKEWNDLSMRERASYIRKAVFRGLSNIDDIREDYRLFGGGGDTLLEDPIYKVLPKLLLEAGLDIRVSSGYRPAGKVGTAGKKSWHWRHGAVDIVPLGKTTFEDIENVIYNNPKIKLYLLSHNFGLLDETGRTKESRLTMQKTGATGPHFHFGRDTNAVNSYRARVGALQGGDHGKVVYFTNPDIPLEPLVPLVSRDNALNISSEPIVPLELIIANAAISLLASDNSLTSSNNNQKAIDVNTVYKDSKDLDIAMEQTLPEVTVIGQHLTLDPTELLSLIQKSLPAPLELEPYLIPIKLNTVGDLAAERNTLLQKDLEDRILSDERRRRLGYAYKDSSIEDDIRQMLFLRNMSANGGKLFLTGGNTNIEEDDYPEGYWENRREHAPIHPRYKRTKKDEEYWAKKNLLNEEAARKLNETAGIVMSALLQSAEGRPFTGNEAVLAAEQLKQDRIDKWHNYKTGIRAAVTAAELGLSGGSLLGAYANWRNWTNAASLTKQAIANILLRAQLPMQVGGTMIDAYQTYDALLRDLDFDAYYNAGSAGLGLAGSAGAADLFRNTRVNYPYIDRILDTAGVILNVGDFLKFGYDTYKNATSLEEKSLSKRNGGNLFEDGGDTELGTSVITTGGTGYIGPSTDVIEFIKGQLKTHPERAKDILYRIISQGNSTEGTKYDRNTLDILKGIYDSITNAPMNQDRYTGSWTWTENGILSNPDRDWNLLYAKGNIKNQYKEIPKELLRGVNLNSPYSTYYGNFVPKGNYIVPDNYGPLLLYLADRNLGGQVRDEETGSGVVGLPLTESEYLLAVKDGFTVDNVGRFNVNIGKDLNGNPEVQFYDLSNFGREYGDTYGGKDAGLQGELADLIGSPFNLRLYVPIRLLSQELLSALPEENKYESYDMGNALLDIAKANKVPVMQHDLDTDTFETVHLPEVVVTGKKHDEGGPLNIILDTNSYGGGGLTDVINVPNAVSGLWNRAKKRLYRTITPEGHHLARAAKEFISGKDRDVTKFTPAENEVWAKYLGVPYEGESSFEKAIYVPTKGGATYDDVIKFKDESLILSDNVLRQLLLNQMATGKNTLLIEGNESGLGTYTVSLGEDENGKYISYYDDWDINPTRGLSAKYKVPFLELVGDIVPGSHPFTVYGRRYYTDEDLRRVIER